jgi:hypothetical protein
VPSSCGRCGSTPLCAMTGPALVGLLEQPLHPRSRIVRFQDGSCCARTESAASRRVVVRAPHDDRRVVPERRRPRRAPDGTGLAAQRARVSQPCSGKSCHTSIPRLVRSRVPARAG